MSAPNLDFVALGDGVGVPSVRGDSAEPFSAELERAMAEPGPHLIEAVIPSAFSG